MAQRIKLTSLLGSHPLGVLASYGLLRLVSEWDATARLGFTMEDDWVAFIEGQPLESVETLSARLAQWAQSDAIERVIGWAPDVRMKPAEYREFLRTSLEEQNLPLAQFLAAFAADGATDNTEKGFIKPSAFYMVSGQQSFLGGMREIHGRVNLNPGAAFREALEGPWKYETPLHSLGWDPSTERLYALRHRSPTSEKPSCVAGAILLALWALPLFPAVSSKRRALTTGFVFEGGSQFFSWPIFSTAIDLFQLKTLIHAGEHGWVSTTGKLRSGIEEVFRSRRSEFGQGYAVLRTPQPAHLLRHSS